MSNTRLGQPIEGPAVWRGSELFDRDHWLVRANNGEADLASVQHQLELGSGATLLRGLAVDGLDEDDIANRFQEIARRIGTPVSQSASGELLLHVRDEAFGKDDPRVRGPHTNKRLSFHTDRCDVIAFLCVRPAKSGGDNHVISSATLYNEMLRRHPDALHVLQDTFPYLRHTVDGGNQRPFTNVPVFTVHEGYFAASLLRVLIDRADKDPGAPNLTHEQRRALDLLEETAEDPDLYASFRLQAGDMLLLNNWVTFHRRTAFEDHDEPERRRHLMRIWLSMPNSRPLDPRFEEHFGATAAGGLRGGMKPR